MKRCCALFLLAACGHPPDHSVQAAGTPAPSVRGPSVDGPSLLDGPASRSPASSEPSKPSEAPWKPAEPRTPTAEELERYAWLTEKVQIRPLEQSFAPPPGYQRVANAPQSFAAFLRGLPLRPAGTPVRSYSKAVLHEGDDSRIAAVAEMDVSPLDVQQCADSVIRLHAEWKWSSGDRASIAYHFLSGDLARWPDYASGIRPIVDNNKVSWAPSAKAASDHGTFRKYLDMVFNYASTISVDQRSSARVERQDIVPGDFFILPGGPGHAILILDMAIDANGKRVAMLGQGYMPAQDFQVLNAPGTSSPWFSFEVDEVDTPFWPAPFPWSSVHRMRTGPPSSARRDGR